MDSQDRSLPAPRVQTAYFTTKGTKDRRGRLFVFFVSLVVHRNAKRQRGLERRPR